MTGLTKGELELARTISGIIEEMHGKIFPKNAEVFVLAQAPPSENERFQYRSQTPSFIADYEGELYLIFGGGLVKRIEKEIQRGIVLFEKNSELLKTTNELPRFSLEEVLIGLASHEVRHSVQYHFPKRRFFSHHLQTTNKLYFKILLRYVEELTKQTYSPEELKTVFVKEFDATLIEHFIVEKWHWGERNISKIATIVASGPNHGCFKSFFK